MKNIILTNGLLCRVDDDDYDYLNQFSWIARKAHDNTASYYAVRTIPRLDGAKYKNGKTKRSMIQMHREIMRSPTNLEIDHIDGDTLNNTKNNLRLATRAQNARNSKLNKRNKIGYRGVRKINTGWYARIFFEGREYSLGGYPTKEQAAKAYDNAAKTYFGKFARLNFP